MLSYGAYLSPDARIRRKEKIEADTLLYYKLQNADGSLEFPSNWSFLVFLSIEALLFIATRPLVLHTQRETNLKDRLNSPDITSGVIYFTCI